MGFYIFKIIISSIIILIITELSKMETLFGSALASIPVVSMISILWIYYETGDTARIAQFSINIFWLVLPSLIFFILFPKLLKLGYNFSFSMISSLILMISLYLIILFFLTKYQKPPIS